MLGYVRKDHVQWGTYAELVAAPVRTLAHRPPGLDVVPAGALPLAGLTALQALRAAGTGPGDTVLVHAASGGVGHLAVQVARELGATRVLGTSSERNADFVRSLGADPVTYGPGLGDRVAGLVGGDGRVDVALDFVGGEALTASPALVHDPARHVSVVDPATVLEQGGTCSCDRTPRGSGGSPSAPPRVASPSRSSRCSIWPLPHCHMEPFGSYGSPTSATWSHLVASGPAPPTSCRSQRRDRIAGDDPDAGERGHRGRDITRVDGEDDRRVAGRTGRHHMPFSEGNAVRFGIYHVTVAGTAALRAGDLVPGVPPAGRRRHPDPRILTWHARH